MPIKPNIVEESEEVVTDLKFDDLIDVQVSAANDGEVPAWNNGIQQWTPAVIAGSTYESIIPVVDIGGAAVSLEGNHSYIMNKSGGNRLVATLPSSAAVGQVIELIGRGSSGWSLEVGLNQTIRIGDQSCTSTTGKVESGSQYDCITIKCTYTNLEWIAISAIGNLTVS